MYLKVYDTMSWVNMYVITSTSYVQIESDDD